MNKTDLELFKTILQDDSIHFTIGKVNKTATYSDNSSSSIECDDIINDTKIICVASFASVGRRTASGDLPDQDDLVLIAIAGGDLNHAYAIARLPSQDEPIPQQIADGHYMTQAQPGKKLYLGSDTKVLIGKSTPGSDPDQPLVLGTQLKTLLANVLTQVAQLAGDVKDLADKVNTLAGNVNSLATDTATHAHGPPGSSPVTAAIFVADGAQATATGTQATLVGMDANGIKTQLNNYKASPVNDGTILSDTAFTEKGGI